MGKTSSYRDALLKSLKDPDEAREYLNAAREDSRESFLKALKNVAQAHQMAKVAREAGVQRETLYRSLSEDGNPTLDTFSSVLEAVGLTFIIANKEIRQSTSPSDPTITTEVHQGAVTMTVTTTPVQGTATGHGYYYSVPTTIYLGTPAKTYTRSTDESLSSLIQNIPPHLLSGIWQGEEARSL